MGIISAVGTGAWLRQSAEVAGLATDVISLLPSNSFRAVKYIAVFYNTTEDVTKTLEFMVNKGNGTIRTTVFNKLGDNISLELSASIVSGNLEVQVINNQTYGLQVEVGYLTLGRE